MIHWRPEIPELRSCPIVGSAVLTTRLSSIGMNRPNTIAARTHHLRRSAPQLYALGELARDDLRMTELAGRLGLAESTVTRVIDRLESAGLVARRTSPPDRRCVVAELTPTGRRLAAELEESRRQFLAE